MGARTAVRKSKSHGIREEASAENMNTDEELLTTN